jgi:hypothetical protein
MPRRSGLSLRCDNAVMSRPSTLTAPPAGSTMRRIVCAAVVLPHPDSPTSATISPRRSENETPSTARTHCCGRLASRSAIDRRTG